MYDVQDSIEQLNEIQTKLDEYEKRIKEIEKIKIKIRAKCETKFNIDKFGEDIYIFSSGINWDPKKAFKLSWTTGNIWIGEFYFVDFGEEFKLIVKTETDEIIWEDFSQNRNVTNQLYDPSSNEIIFNITFGIL